MRTYLLLIIFLSSTSFATAQPVTKTEPIRSEKYDFREGSTKTTTVSTDPSLNKIITIEFKDKGVVRDKYTWKKDLSGKWERTEEELTPSGKSVGKSVVKIDETGKITSMECSETTDDGVKHHHIFSRTPAGGFKEKGNDNDPESGFGPDPKSIKFLENYYKEEIKEIEENVLPSLEPKSTGCASTFNPGCQSQFVVFAGPSVLFVDFGTDKEALFGGHASALFNISKRIEIGLDASLYSKKFGTENLTRSFIMVDGQYTFGDVTNCDRKIIPDIHVLAGFGSEKYGSSKGSGFAFGAGTGLDIRLTNTIAIRTQADFLGIKFKNTDELNKNFRFSMGVVLFVLNIKRQMYGGASLINLNEQ